MTADLSDGWDDVAGQFLAFRSNIGAALVRAWAQHNLAQGGAVVDVGCGSGVPISKVLHEEGFHIFGIDASPTLLDAFRRNFPDAPSACEAAQNSRFFNRQFDAAVAVGLMFLLAEEDQRKLIRRVAKALRPGGRFLFSAPRARCEWDDLLTGRRSVSLGADSYERVLAAAGLSLLDGYTDEGENHYYDVAKPAG
ncbi:class I SAM-dependent methyltransferase [Kordiimonas aestuarii]|uniref:class I SAM-dependent methyltransferase n=1 Tax=Kordiimonas aestuarii TaxID=1005925 RepID=UPI0021D15ACA|nr:class I SAM-dependent methyltransferase [Kordiimonas aestuarii]